MISLQCNGLLVLHQFLPNRFYSNPVCFLNSLLSVLLILCFIILVFLNLNNLTIVMCYIFKVINSYSLNNNNLLIEDLFSFLLLKIVNRLFLIILVLKSELNYIKYLNF